MNNSTQEQAAQFAVVLTHPRFDRPKVENPRWRGRFPGNVVKLSRDVSGKSDGNPMDSLTGSNCWFQHASRESQISTMSGMIGALAGIPKHKAVAAAAAALANLHTAGGLRVVQQ